MTAWRWVRILGFGIMGGFYWCCYALAWQVFGLPSAGHAALLLTVASFAGALIPSRKPRIVRELEARERALHTEVHAKGLAFLEREREERKARTKGWYR